MEAEAAPDQNHRPSKRKTRNAGPRELSAFLPCLAKGLATGPEVPTPSEDKVVRGIQLFTLSNLSVLYVGGVTMYLTGRILQRYTNLFQYK